MSESSHALPLLARPRFATRAAWLLVCVALIAVVAVADYATGYEVSLSLLYVAPVFLATWAAGLGAGVAMSLFATATWYVMFASEHPFETGLYHGWEAVIRAITAGVFAYGIHRLKLALARSDARFVTVLESLSASVYVSDARTGELLYMNEHCRTAFGPRVPRHIGDIERRFTSTMPGGVTQDEREDALSGRWYLHEVQPIRWVDGRAVTLHVAADITSRKQSERLAHDRQQKLEMSSRLITAGEMASTLAHELNQPLAAILNYNSGCIDLLQAGGSNASDILEGLQKSSEQAERAGRIVQQVREFIRRREPQMEPCDFGDVLREAARLIAPQASRASTALIVEVPPQRLPVVADPVMLQQLVLNLSVNALESMRAAPAETRELRLRAAAEAGKIRLEVADRGRGLPAELRERLFIPFYTTKPAGMGLGLQICRSVAEYHDGQLSAAARPGGGTIFNFVFPLKAS